MRRRMKRQITRMQMDVKGRCGWIVADESSCPASAAVVTSDGHYSRKQHTSTTCSDSHMSLRKRAAIPSTLCAARMFIVVLVLNPLTPTVAMGTAIKLPVPDRVKPSFGIFDICAFWQPWASESPDVKYYKWRLNTVGHRSFIIAVPMATVWRQRVNRQGLITGARPCRIQRTGFSTADELSTY